MIEFARILDIDRHMLEVQMRTGESLFAPILVSAGGSLPSKEWIDNHKNHFIAVVAFEKGLGQNPMVVGFYPVQGAQSEVYGSSERLLAACTALLETLLNAKINTSIGPQPFMPNTYSKLQEIKQELDAIGNLITPFE